MKITYDPEADALYIELRDAAPHTSIDLEPGVLADLDKDRHIVGFEILDASERLSAEELSSLSYENLVTEKVTRMKAPDLMTHPKAGSKSRKVYPPA
ncbi:MAG TPA: DUF2283 domain-containing protein [Dehalococcoidia bacterium]|nr:DUF2283 domain-containing protein [Dehalococcoidia bacterium]